MGQADPLAARCSVKGCREQQYYYIIWLARFYILVYKDMGRRRRGVQSC
jgi:hypothetical protein